jgi:hypothetical protein
MSAIPGTLDTGQQPPMTVPLRHFFVALGFLLAGLAVGIGRLTGVVSGGGRIAHVHLLLRWCISSTRTRTRSYSWRSLIRSFVTLYRRG